MSIQVKWIISILFSLFQSGPLQPAGMQDNPISILFSLFQSVNQGKKAIEEDFKFPYYLVYFKARLSGIIQTIGKL